MTKEYILCAANHYDDGIIYDFKPININTGFVICGHRHHDCIFIFAKMFGFPYDEDANKLQCTEEQGFLTNANRFVSRGEAFKIAQSSGQITDTDLIGRLHSEDLY